MSGDGTKKSHGIKKRVVSTNDINVNRDSTGVGVHNGEPVGGERLI